MKHITLLFFITFYGFSQNAVERANILKASNKVFVDSIKSDIFNYSINQSKLIADYAAKHNLSSEKRFSLQRIIDGQPIYYSTDNALSVAAIRANALYPGGSLGLNVTGSGIIVGVWDGGKVRNTHQELTGRILFADGASTLSSHSTHVTGTILAEGVSPTRKGVAYQANAWAYDFFSDANEMISFGSNGYLVSNHSYGNVAANLQSFTFGSYNSQSAQIDNIMNAFPYYQIVKSAGNDRNDTSLAQVQAKNGFDLISGYSTAKNILTVAALENVNTYTGPEDVIMSNFSNFGPTDDGRIKPDISSKGVSISSTNSTSDTAYTVLQGTSMAAPAISGLIILLQKHYNNLNPGTYMKSASVRALLCQSTREAGANPGPDYSFGWGLADGYNSARIITNKGTTAIFDELTLNNSTSFSTSFTINSAQNINVVIAWTDPTGTQNASGDEDNREPRLRNNLDLKVLKDGTTYYPWKLNPDEPSNPATNTTDNDVDNIERVEIFNATPGTYTIQVTHKGTLQGDSQEFSLIATTPNGLTLNSPDFVADNSFFVYPNPAKDVISFSNPNSFDVKEVSITDITGKLVVLNPVITSNSIDISSLQTGVYFIKFTTENFSTVKKFVKN